MYYDPTNIPNEYLRPHAKKGMVHGKHELVDEGGFNAEANNALHDGGPQNGVLTAVEDFLKRKRQYIYFASSSEFGLGVIVKRQMFGPVFLKWYWKVKLFDAKTFVRPFTKIIKRTLL